MRASSTEVYAAPCIRSPTNGEKNTNRQTTTEQRTYSNTVRWSIKFSDISGRFVKQPQISVYNDRQQVISMARQKSLKSATVGHHYMLLSLLCCGILRDENNPVRGTVLRNVQHNNWNLSTSSTTRVDVRGGELTKYSGTDVNEPRCRSGR